MNNTTFIEHSAAGKLWQQIGITHHHGLNIPLFSLHSDQSIGIGEYLDLIPLIRWCKSIGFDVIQLLPLNDTGLGVSPYSAISAFALNSIYLCLAELPYLSDHPELVAELNVMPKLSNMQQVDYKKVREVKFNFLLKYYQHTRTTITSCQAYQQFLSSQKDWLKGYAVFKTLKILHEWSSWEEWPEEYRNPTPELLEQVAQKYPEQIEWQMVIQYLCDAQFRQVKAEADKNHVFLMGDIPIMIDRDSADVWLYRSLFNLNYSAGSPPDMYSAEGQNWGFPIYNWEVIAQDGFKWWTERLKFANRFFHICRIDHVVGFFRIWSIPFGRPGHEGFFIPTDQSIWIDHGQKLMLMMLNASDMLLIGEDLGVVPPEVRQCLTVLGICGTRVMRWERKWNEDGSFISPQTYPIDSLTTVSTHDSETLLQWWQNNPREAEDFARYKGWSYQPNLSRDHLKEILWDSHHSSSLFHINLLQEYLALTPGLTHENLNDERINVPGVVNDQNWTYRFIPSVEEITSHSTLTHLMKELII